MHTVPCKLCGSLFFSIFRVVHPSPQSVLEHFICLRRCSALLCRHPDCPSFSPRQPWIYSLSMVLPILDICLRAIMNYMILLSVRERRVSLVYPHCSHSSVLFLFMTEYYSVVWIYHISCISLGVDEHLGFSTFWLLWSVRLWAWVSLSVRTSQYPFMACLSSVL